MNHFRVTYTNGESYTTQANGTLKEFTDYLMQFGGIVVDENPVTGKETRKQIAKVEEVKRTKPQTGLGFIIDQPENYPYPAE